MDKKSGTRVFKKTSPNGKITTYLGKRDFIDSGDHVDIIDGMVLLDEEYVTSGKKIMTHLLAAFRYGREDLDVLGLTFRKDLVSQYVQIFPVLEENQSRPLTRLQERLKKKLGPNAFPFWFEIPPLSASSVTLQPAPGDTGKPCGVDYELKTYVDGCVDINDKPKKHNSKPQPIIEVSKEFMMSPGLLHLEISLDREMFYHGETIAVNVHIQNNSNRTVKKIKAFVVQTADICLFTTATYNCDVAKIESTEGFPVGPGSTLSKVYNLMPLLLFNRDKRGLALDGQLKHEDTNLASSTILSKNTTKENLGIIVQYKIRVRLSIAGALGGELVAELPFTLTHAKPAESPVESKKNILDIDNTETLVNGNDTKPEEEIDLIQWDSEPDDNGIEEEKNDVKKTFDDLFFDEIAKFKIKDTENEALRNHLLN
ncbi:Arrestin family and Arrestin-like, N-terminal domain and Arrestin C-terminal-like domain and Arrestin, C-terminal domain and Arrestin, N-terminal domain and Immunoglobulin E-set domain-containing protein [Strongyloides ratti]|uniref:Arrestin C-terminal-like domain-containing protein n=1 Tax=Strongyloides ratti TaxID=34506 RepID=A0A090MVX4_STRRB|nr:Arrestin family and Arrestin-like, N-terminal domain and Arrestin C-terminal-like domain and Arrestin, C-terminal domain and Arrestin, N-terminal domain and Immunoglobulin E-set domain-containing protein [Strongyloides ratti]CEF63188.1 Arrestin family and Arrestin-like, N-terminal domain and Arrestin C-terminal-like domain and Arrestin, C-terminal domain and Arrestin, N-terminal domain and Immunoglobulin E-set domain-containing protein [Strongyloides ratti]